MSYVFAMTMCFWKKAKIWIKIEK